MNGSSVTTTAVCTTAVYNERSTGDSTPSINKRRRAYTHYVLYNGSSSSTISSLVKSSSSHEPAGMYLVRIILYKFYICRYSSTSKYIRQQYATTSASYCCMLEGGRVGCATPLPLSGLSVTLLLYSITYRTDVVLYYTTYINTYLGAELGSLGSVESCLGHPALHPKHIPAGLHVLPLCRDNSSIASHLVLLRFQSPAPTPRIA